LVLVAASCFFIIAYSRFLIVGFFLLIMKSTWSAFQMIKENENIEIMKGVIK